MPALFAYILAIILLLGGGYAGLQWLAEPAPVAIHVGKESSKSRKTAEQAQPSADVDGRYSVAQGSVPGGAQSKPAEAAAGRPAADDSSKTTQTPSEPHSGPSVTNPALADVPRGGCMPFGITENGEMVFPMECQAILAQYGAGQKAPQPDPVESTPAAKQAAENDKALQSNPAPQQDERRAELKPDAKIEDTPPGSPADTKSDPETDLSKTKRVTKQTGGPVHPKGVMMVLRTIEFPDGHREQRLLPMSRWRRMSFRSEPW
jgi:hypothetical protein